MKRKTMLLALMAMLILPSTAFATAEDSEDVIVVEEESALPENSTEPAAWNESGRSDSEVLNTMISSVEVIEDDDFSVEPTEDGNAAATTAEVAINETNFPDELFRGYVESEIDKNQDKILNPTEIENTTMIDVSYEKISSLKGIEYFTSLEYLDCENNYLKELDVSHNTNLITLYCENTDKGTSDIEYTNCIETLNLGEITNLRSLSCSNNKIHTLDLHNCSKLRELYCYNNNLDSLNVNSNLELETIDCSQNNIKTIDISKNTNLQSFSCYSNNLDILDVSNNTKLFFLSCSSNNLNELDVSKNKNLITLNCSSNNFNNLDISQNTTLQFLNCNNNKLKTLDLSKNVGLITLDCMMNEFLALDLSNNVALQKYSNYFTTTVTAYREDNHWKFNFKELIGKENLDRISIDFASGDPINNDGIFDYSNFFISQLIECTYDTKCPSGIDPKCKIDILVRTPECNHNFGPYETVTAPTVLKNGIAARTCTICGEKQTKTIEKLKGTIKLTSSKISLQVKKSISAKDFVTGMQEGDSISTWKSANAKIASVDENGKITGKTIGTTKIEVVLKSGASATLQVTVQKKVIETEKISGLKKNISLKVGKSKTLKPVITPADSQQKVTYNSSNKKIASVNGKGVIKGLKKGETKITVTSGSKKFVIKVKVTK